MTCNTVLEFKTVYSDDNSAIQKAKNHSEIPEIINSPFIGFISEPNCELKAEYLSIR